MFVCLRDSDRVALSVRFRVADSFVLHCGDGGICLVESSSFS